MKALGIFKSMGYDFKNTEEVYSKPYSPGTFQTPRSIIDYLENGCPLLGQRGFSGVDTDIYTDGTYLWSGDYTNCLQQGSFKVDPDFMAHMERNDFQVPENIDNEKILAIIYPEG